MPERAVRFDPSIRRLTILHTRAEPDDLYDPPTEEENADPELVDAEDYDVDDFDIYGLDDYDEDDE